MRTSLLSQPCPLYRGLGSWEMGVEHLSPWRKRHCREEMAATRRVIGPFLGNKSMPSIQCTLSSNPHSTLLMDYACFTVEETKAQRS